MINVTPGSDAREAGRVPKRSWRMALLAALAGIAAGTLAIIVEGTPRTALVAASVVLLITAFLCVGITSLESHSGPPFDPDEPPAEPPVPPSQVTLVHDPGKHERST